MAGDATGGVGVAGAGRIGRKYRRSGISGVEVVVVELGRVAVAVGVALAIVVGVEVAELRSVGGVYGDCCRMLNNNCFIILNVLGLSGMVAKFCKIPMVSICDGGQLRTSGVDVDVGGAAAEGGLGLLGVAGRFMLN